MCFKICGYQGSQPPHPGMFHCRTCINFFWGCICFWKCKPLWQRTRLSLLMKSIPRSLRISITESTQKIYMAKIWFGMYDLDFRSPMVATGMVSFFLILYLPSKFISDTYQHYISHVHILVNRNFFIKVLVWGYFVYKV